MNVLINTGTGIETFRTISAAFTWGFLNGMTLEKVSAETNQGELTVIYNASR